MDDLEALILVERAKREAAELIQRYEQELFVAGRYLECVQLGIARYVLTAPIDFVEWVEALRAACPEIDRQRRRGELRAKLAEWRSQTEGR